MGHSWGKPLSVKLRVCRGMWSSAIRSMIRDTWQVVIQGSTEMSINPFPRDVTRNVSKITFGKVCGAHGTWSSSPSPQPTSVSHLRCFHKVIDVNVKVVVELDEVDGRFGLHLMDNHASSFRAVLFGIFHLLPDEAVHDLTRLTLRWGRVICNGPKQTGM